jgi:hypothetical protein
VNLLRCGLKFVDKQRTRTQPPRWKEGFGRQIQGRWDPIFYRKFFGGMPKNDNISMSNKKAEGGFLGPPFFVGCPNGAVGEKRGDVGGRRGFLGAFL